MQTYHGVHQLNLFTVDGNKVEFNRFASHQMFGKFQITVTSQIPDNEHDDFIYEGSVEGKFVLDALEDDITLEGRYAVLVSTKDDHVILLKRN